MIYNATKKTRKALNKLRKQALKKPKKKPRHLVGAILTFLNVSAVLCFLCSYDLFENQFVFLFECKYNTKN